MANPVLQSIEELGWRAWYLHGAELASGVEQGWGWALAGGVEHGWRLKYYPGRRKRSGREYGRLGREGMPSCQQQKGEATVSNRSAAVPVPRHSSWFIHFATEEQREKMALAAPSSLRRLPATPPQARSPPPASRLREPRLRLRLRRSLVAAAAAAAPLSASASPEDKERRKHELLRAVQETRRGFAAGPDQRAAIEEAVVAVEELGAGEGAPLDLAELDGTWRLCYTSASDVLVLFEAAERLPLLQVGQIYQKFECKDQSDGGIVRNVVRWSIENLLEDQEGATLMVSAKFLVLSKRNIFLQFEEVSVENIKISEQVQALIAPAILPRSFLSLQILQFLKTFRAQVPVSGPERRSPGGLYYLSYLDRDMLLGRSIGGGGLFIFTRAQPLV